MDWMTKTPQPPDKPRTAGRPAAMLRWIIAATAGLLVVISLAWVAAETALDHVLDRTIPSLHAAGFELAAGRRVRGGWPGSATLRLDAVRLDGPVRTGAPDGTVHNLTLHWRAEALVLQASLLHPRSVILIARGTQHVSLGELPELTLWGDRLAAYLPWQPRLPMPLPVEARALHAALGANGPDWITTIADARGSLLFSGGGNLAVRLSMQAITLPQAGQHPFGRTIERMTIAAALPPGLGSPSWPGMEPLLLQDLTVEWSALHLRLRGSVHPMPPGGPFPVGQFSLSVHGVRAALRAAAGDGDLSRGEAMALNGLAGLLEQAHDGGAVDTDTLHDLPVLLHDNVLWLGTVPLWRLG